MRDIMNICGIKSSI